MAETTKQCIKCSQVLPLSKFSLSSARTGRLDGRCKECVKNYRKELVENSAPEIEYPVIPLNLESSDWQVGKPAGSIAENPKSFTAKVQLPDALLSKCFTFSRFPSKEAARTAAKNWQVETSNEHGLTRNRIKVIDPNTIQVELTKGYVMTTDMQFSDTVQKRSLVAGKSGCATSEYYAIIVINHRNVFFHKHITGFPMTDHINKNPMDNRLANLRKADHKLNNNNRSGNKKFAGTDHIMGVRFIAKDNAYQARIKQDGKERTKSFSVSKYGEEEAKRMAIEFREQLCAQFNSTNKN